MCGRFLRSFSVGSITRRNSEASGDPECEAGGKAQPELYISSLNQRRHRFAPNGFHFRLLDRTVVDCHVLFHGPVPLLLTRRRRHP